MNLSNIIPGLPSEFWEVLVELAKKGEWLTTSNTTDDASGRPRTRFEVDRSKVSDLKSLAPQILKADNGIFLMWMDTLAKMSATGVKMFKPSYEQCEAMEHVKINLPICDYRQPYPVMLLEFPEEYRKSLHKRTGRTPPRHIMVQHREKDRMFFSGCSLGFFGQSKNAGYHDELFYIFSDRPQFATIEDAIQSDGVVARDVSPEEDAKRKIINEAMTRVAMNLCMLLVDVPVLIAATAPKMLEGRKVNPVEKATHVHTIRLAQDIIVRKFASTSVRGEPTGRTVEPHWRHGYRRRQHYGVGNAQTKVVFIPPVFVKRAAFTGDLSTTSVVYRDSSQNKIDS